MSTHLLDTIFSNAAAMGLVDIFVKITLLLFVVGAINTVWRPSPRIAHALWGVGITGILALPLLGPVLPSIDIPIVSRPPTLFPVVDDTPVLADRPVDFAGVAVARADTAASATDRRLPSSAAAVAAPGGPSRGTAGAWVANHVGEIVVSVWLLGSLLLIVRLTWAIHAVDRIARRARRLREPAWRHSLEVATATTGVGRAVDLSESDEVTSPFASGVLRPVIVMPTTAQTWSPERRRVVLVHELLHLKYHDWLLQIGGFVARALYWPNPLVWFAARQLAEERERACDEEVVSLGTRPTEYAEHLLAIARAGAGGRTPPVAAMPMARGSRLEGRVLALLRFAQRRPRSSRSAVPAAVLLAVLVVLVAAWQPRPPAPQALASADTSLVFVTAPVADVARSDRPDTARYFVARVEPVAVNVADDCLGAIAPNRPLSGRFTGSISHTTGPNGERIVRRIGYADRDYLLERDDADGFCLYVRMRDSVEFERDGRVHAMSDRAIFEIATGMDDVVTRVVITQPTDGALVMEWTGDAHPRPDAWLDAALAVFHDLRAIADLRGQESSLRGRISSIRGRESSLRGRISSIRGRESSLRGRISSLRGRESSLRGRISSIRGRRSSLEGRISSIRGRESSYRGRISSLQADRGAVERYLRRFDDEPSARDLARLQEIDARIDETEQAIRELRVAERVAEVRDQIDGLAVEDSVAAIEQQIAALRGDEGEARIRTQIEDLRVEERVREIEQEIVELRVDERVQEIEDRIEALDADRRVAEIERRLEPNYDRLRALAGR